MVTYIPSAEAEGIALKSGVIVPKKWKTLGLLPQIFAQPKSDQVCFKTVTLEARLQQQRLDV
jgi:hypothetical protein